MTEENKDSIYKGVELHPETNNTEHHTSEISVDELIVRRGQPFKLTLKLAEPFNPAYPLHIMAVTGDHPSEDRGTMSRFSVPNNVKRSPSAKAVWTVELDKGSLLTGNVNLTITTPADAPIGQYVLNVTHRDEEMLLAILVVLFNPWCPDDWVFLSKEKHRREYVMNEQGLIYTGSADYIYPLKWDFGQFEDSMVNICLKILDLNHKHMDDPADDVSARCNPIYVSRVISAMINSEDDWGVLEGRWERPYSDGVTPTHWNGSHKILMKWLESGCHPVKYGQCWVFAGVMCSVMRLLGIPCRVVTNFKSAHDNNGNLTIDVYHSEEGVEEKESHDSIWNFHVWVEGWMRRPDLEEDGKFDGWQVLDPTPQEKSDGVYCCGPAPVKAILNGETDLKYDIPFVFAEANADCIHWLLKADGSKVIIRSNTKRVGQKISTKSLSCNRRRNITRRYKHKEGSRKERAVFKYAISKNNSKVNSCEEMEEEEVENEEMDTVDNAPMEENGGTERSETTDESMEEATPNNVPQLPQLSLRFEEVSRPINGKDVSLELVVHSESSAARPLSIYISVQGMSYNGLPAINIQTEVKEKTLQPKKDLSIPILVPFLAYHKHMVDCDSMKVSALVMDPDNIYLAEDDVVLFDPPISVNVSSRVRLNHEATGDVVFKNPVNETLKACTVTLSGSGLLKEDIEKKVANMKPGAQIRVPFSFVPYKTGVKTLVVDFDCSTFRDIKGSCTIHVKP